MAGGAHVLLVRREGEIFAIGEVCGDVIQCPWRHSRFYLRDGSIVDGPATTRSRSSR